MSVYWRGVYPAATTEFQADGSRFEWTIDGGDAQQGGSDPGRERWGVRRLVAQGLADGRHVLELRPLDGRPLRLDGVIVDREVRSPGLGPPAAMFLLGVVGVAIAALSSRRPRA